MLADLFPDSEQDALALVLAGAVLVRPAEVPAAIGPSTAATICPRVISEGGLRGRIPPRPRLDRTRPAPFRASKYLLEDKAGVGRSFGYVTNRSRAKLLGVQRQRQKRAAGVIAPSRDLHGQMLSGVDPSEAVSPGTRWVACARWQPQTGSPRHAGVRSPGTTADGSLADPGAAPSRRLRACPVETAVPDWLPEPARRESDRAALVVDGLGWGDLPRPGAPSDPRLGRRRADHLGRSTTTATALTSISTGLATCRTRPRRVPPRRGQRPAREPEDPERPQVAWPTWRTPGMSLPPEVSSSPSPPSEETRCPQ